MHSTASDTSRITFPLAGVYMVSGAVRLTVVAGSSDTPKDYSLALKLNGTSYLAQDGGSYIGNPDGSPAFAFPLNVSTIYTFAANDYVELELTHEFNATASSTYVAGVSPVFSAARLL
jgi:hypothetical protein